MKNIRFPVIKFRASEKHKSSKLAMFSLLATLLSGVGKFLFALIVGRVLGPSALGLTQSVIATANLASLCLPTTSGAAASKYVSQEIALGRKDFEISGITNHLFKRVIQSIIVVSIFVAIGLLTTQNTNIVIILVSVMLIVAVSLQVFVRGLYFGTSQLRSLFWGELFVNIFILVGTLVLLFLGVKPVWLLTPMILAIIVWIVLSYPFGNGLKLEKSVSKQVDIFLLIGSWGTLASAGFMQASVLFSTIVGGFVYAGQYAAAMTLSTPIGLLSGAVASVLFPELSKYNVLGNVALISRKLVQTIQLLSTLSIGIFGVMALSARSIMMIIWGNNFQQTGEILIWLTFSMAITAIAAPAVVSLTSHSNRGMLVSAISSTIGLLLGLSVWLIGSLAKVPELIPVGYAAGAFVIAAIPFVISWRKYQLRLLRTSLISISTVILILCISLSIQSIFIPIWIEISTSILFLICWSLFRKSDVFLMISALKQLGRPAKDN